MLGPFPLNHDSSSSSNQVPVCSARVSWIIEWRQLKSSDDNQVKMSCFFLGKQTSTKIMRHDHYDHFEQGFALFQRHFSLFLGLDAHILQPHALLHVSRVLVLFALLVLDAHGKPNRLPLASTDWYVKSSAWGIHTEAHHTGPQKCWTCIFRAPPAALWPSLSSTKPN